MTKLRARERPQLPGTEHLASAGDAGTRVPPPDRPWAPRWLLCPSTEGDSTIFTGVNTSRCVCREHAGDEPARTPWAPGGSSRPGALSVCAPGRGRVRLHVPGPASLARSPSSGLTSFQLQRPCLPEAGSCPPRVPGPPWHPVPPPPAALASPMDANSSWAGMLPSLASPRSLDQQGTRAERARAGSRPRGSLSVSVGPDAALRTLANARGHGSRSSVF